MDKRQLKKIILKALREGMNENDSQNNLDGAMDALFLLDDNVKGSRLVDALNTVKNNSALPQTFDYLIKNFRDIAAVLETIKNNSQQGK